MVNITTDTESIEREKLLQLSREYRNQGYEILVYPKSKDLPDFLSNYCPDMIARRDDETVVIEVKSRRSFDLSSSQYLRNLAQVIEKHSGWRFELVIINPEEPVYLAKAEGILQENEIRSRLKIVQQLALQQPESAILLSWILVEATLRLIAEKERLNLSRIDPVYLIKIVATEGIISSSQYKLLMNSYSLRNTIAHGFKVKQVNQDLVYELTNMIEQLLKDIHNQEKE